MQWTVFLWLNWFTHDLGQTLKLIAAHSPIDDVDFCFCFVYSHTFPPSFMKVVINGRQTEELWFTWKVYLAVQMIEVDHDSLGQTNLSLSLRCKRIMPAVITLYENCYCCNVVMFQWTRSRRYGGEKYGGLTGRGDCTLSTHSKHCPHLHQLHIHR